MRCFVGLAEGVSVFEDGCYAAGARGEDGRIGEAKVGTEAGLKLLMKEIGDNGSTHVA